MTGSASRAPPAPLSAAARAAPLVDPAPRTRVHRPIRTARLLLRPVVPDDWRPVLAYQSDPRFHRFYPWTDRSEADARAFVRRFLDWQLEEPQLRFPFTIEREGEAIGNASIRCSAVQPDTADMGYELAPEHWGNGYATEAARAVLRFGFRELGLHRVGAHCVAENAASAAVLRRIGMREEGRMRDAEHFKERWWDVLLFAVLREEWEGEIGR